jgi:hypothetical protein
MTLDTLFTYLWQDYTARLCPSAYKIHHLLRQDSELNNDHIALRTFNLAPLGLETLAKPFEALGYRACGDYQFKQKKLKAKHYEHPDPSLPKVFISELLVEQLSLSAQHIIAHLVDQVDQRYFSEPDFLYSGRPWALSLEQYHTLNQETEYASWVAAHGYGANHFTVNVNQLTHFEEVAMVNEHLKQHGFTINHQGGEVKGSPQEMLEQSSTMADSVLVDLVDGELYLPGGFYEFAKRYPQENGMLYRGFVAASADKIFESTHQKR